MKVPKRTAVVGGAAALVLGVAAPAIASHTVVTVGGDGTDDTVAVVGTNSSSSIGFISSRGTELECTIADIDGNIFQGATVDVAVTVGEITDLLFDECTAADFFDVDVTMSAGDITVRAHPTNAGDDVPITIEVPTATVSGTGCSFTASGSVDAVIHAGTNGTTPPDGHIELIPVDFGPPPSGFDLDVTVPGGGSTCGGEVHDNDTAGPSDLITSEFSLDTLGEGDVSHG